MTISTNAPVNGSTNDGIGGSGTGVISTYTAAQLDAMELAGTLTPYATYVASDESPYQQWALDASTLGSPLGGEYVTVSVAGASGGVVEI